MSDTTAPRTAAADLAEKRAALSERWVGRGLAPMTEFEMAGAVHRDSLVGVGPEASGSIDAYDRRGLLNLVAALLDREREAIEPLLALVRAALALAHAWTIPEYPHPGLREDGLIDALAALPESVRVAARKPE